ncbi:hypothetical protein [Pseudonocardia sp.]|uniref:hypothetical protein n=1 Tax=Pseudonocardia sp. TaxID=60912 RepID=UPI0031FCA446
MPLNPLNAASKPGRLPTAEAASLPALLEANGFPLADRRAARSLPADDVDLAGRFQLVPTIENLFVPGATPALRRQLLRMIANDIFG